MIEKCFIRLVSIIRYVLLKIRYGSRLVMQPINPIRGRIRIDLQNKDARLAVGKYMMSMGPLYIKCRGYLHIGDYCFFNHNVSITCNESITIGDYCNIANNVVIVDHDHVITYEGVLGKTKSNSISIGNRVWIGANSVITSGTSIGDGSVIAAGAVVTTNVPPHEIWGGVPARMIKRIEKG